MESLDALAADLEARDAAVAAELARVEAAQAEVDALRGQAEAAAETLAWLPQAISENEHALHEALRAVARLEEHRRAFAEQERETLRAAGAVAQAVGAGSLDEAVALLSQRRGALLVEHSNLAREREAVVREASELLAAVTGDPSATTSVAGLRARLT